MVTDDLTLDDGGRGTDVVGLIAGGYVWVYHPLDNSGKNLPGYHKVREIDAAVLSLRHSFVVQNWDHGQYLGSLHVRAPGQKLREAGRRERLVTGQTTVPQGLRVRHPLQGHPAAVLPQARRQPVAGADGH